MNIKDIKIGQILRIVGIEGGCGDDISEKCINCRYYPEHLIKVMNTQNNEVRGTRRRSLTDKSKVEGHCGFNPNDLRPTTITNWRSQIQ